jgi:carbon-monoxide dehydrogenase large subunit/6-hydroxypseudooxynicotine dehydrogenase subunit gamma
MTASATHAAAQNVRSKALGLAAELLQAPVDALDIIDGHVVRIDRPSGPSITLGELAANLTPTAKARGDREPGLSADGWFNTEHQVYPYGSHVAVVRVDRDTGGVTVERYVIGYDIGRAINPLLVKGQIAGGFTQGLGGALMEQFLYTENGDPLCATFVDYLLPSLRETPDVDIVLTEEAPSPLNPLGIKGAGESGITAVGATIACAVEDAIGIPGAIKELPITPQRLKDILDGSR